MAASASALSAKSHNLLKHMQGSKKCLAVSIIESSGCREECACLCVHGSDRACMHSALFCVSSSRINVDLEK